MKIIKTLFKIAFFAVVGFIGLFALVAIFGPKMTPEQRAAYSAKRDAQMQTDLKARAETKAKAKSKPAGKVETVGNLQWRKVAFGTVMEADLRIRNTTDFDVKDLVIGCTEYAPSGTAIDHNTRTVYQIIKAGETRTLPKVNLGFVQSQATVGGCEVISYDKVK
jgi:hypothetical protein